MSRRIEIERVNASLALVRGYGSRDLLKDLTRSVPVWATRDRAWVTQPHRVADLCALAESRGFVVEIVEIVEPGTDPGGGRW